MLEGKEIDAWYTIQGDEGPAGDVHLIFQLHTNTPKSNNSSGSVSLPGADSPATPRGKMEMTPSPRRGSDGNLPSSGSSRMLTHQGSGNLLVDPTTALAQLFNLEKEDQVKECANCDRIRF